MWFASLKIPQRLTLGFGAVLLLTVVMGAMAIRTMTAMSSLTSDLYTHSFTVTNELLQVQGDVNSLRADMLTLWLSLDLAEVERVAAHIAATDADIARHLDVVAQQYLGPAADVRTLADTLERWKEVREHGIAEARAGRAAAAMANGRAKGRPMAAQALKDLDTIFTFASAKAAELKQGVERERTNATVQILLTLAGMLAAGLLLARTITNSIVKPLAQLRQCMVRLSDGELSVEVPHRQGKTEVAEMARAVEVFKDSAVRLDRQRWIKEGVARLSIALQTADSLPVFGQATLETLAPLLEATAATFQVRREGEDRQPIARWGKLEADGAESLSLPIRLRGAELGVIALSSPAPISEQGRSLLDEAAPVLALNLEILNRHLRTKELLEQTIAQASALQASQAEVERFAEVLAHHIQEPVRLQHSFAELLLRTLPPDAPEEARTALGFIVNGAVRLRSLIRDVQLYLGLTQIASIPSRPCKAELAFEVARRPLAGRLQEIGAVIDKAPLPELRINEARLTDVFRLLLDNAIQYRSPQRPLRITVTAERRGAMEVLGIEDNGLGIAPEYRDRVFRVFERLHSNTDTPGTGIGLALVQKIVELANGRVWIESGQDGGTRVCLSLPAAKDL